MDKATAREYGLQGYSLRVLHYLPCKQYHERMAGARA